MEKLNTFSSHREFGLGLDAPILPEVFSPATFAGLKFEPTK